VLRKLRDVLGDRAIFLTGERSIGDDTPVAANASVCFPFQPGLFRAIGRTKPDVVIGDGFFKWTCAALLYRIWNGIPLVVCYERWSHNERNAQWYRRLYRRMAFRFTDAVCCNGRLCADYTQSLGFPANRITIGHMAADTEGLAARAHGVSANVREELRKSWKATGLVFLYVGRLIKLKGMAQMLQAWNLFQGQHSAGATLVLVGTGPEEDALKDQVASNDLKGVCFIGDVDYDLLANYYAAADLFIMPTLEDNWSLVVPEAMACGLPILCSKYNGCWPELVQEGRNGWVFDPLDSSSFQSVLNLALQNHAKLHAMGRESRMIIAGHSPAHSAQAIYSTCLLASKNRV
jgi:glycosyltransferase involved in cell wall biosynthesis